jgi:hypothetical protein
MNCINDSVLQNFKCWGKIPKTLEKGTFPTFLHERVLVVQKLHFHTCGGKSEYENKGNKDKDMIRESRKRRHSCCLALDDLGSDRVDDSIVLHANATA